jgi:hypothetical protein
MSSSHQPIIMGHSIHLCLCPLHWHLQWHLSNCWLHRMPSSRGWQKLVSLKLDVRNNINSLKNPPTSTSWQHTLQCSPRWKIRLKLTTGFKWPSLSLDYFTVRSTKRHCLQHNNSVVPQVPRRPHILPLFKSITKCRGMRCTQCSTSATF